ncbi:MAG: DUF3467 domain-containing protein [Mycobacterium sp.]|nr:DUF3467 domain-containing protein [Mycobacterium sp.]
MSDEPAQPQTIGQIRTPERWTAGVYADGVGGWHSQTDFTIDFMVSLPPEMGKGEDGTVYQIAPQQIVARVKIPPSLMPELIGNLQSQLDTYCQRFGRPPQYGTGIFGIDDQEGDGT